MSTTSPTSNPKRKSITTQTFLQKKQRGERISMLTAYDYQTAMAVDESGVDSILVGDSLGMVVLGYENTLSVTMEDMLHHCKAVARGAKHALLVGDMPFMTYQVSIPEAVRNAGAFLQQANMHAVKLEGGVERIPTIQAILSAGIPVMGHLGLTPQSVHRFGGFRPQGMNVTAAHQILEDALRLQDAGVFSIVLESVPARLAAMISSRLEIPTIGIGAGAGCDGQVLVVHDMLGLFERFTPRFVKKYANLYPEMIQAFEEYKREVESGAFPATEHTVDLPDDEWQEFLKTIDA
ncbi:MAG: 3-methyl-2-oxobutanoate hydroxymethyltransferase [Anaerolineaceae bacterium]